MKSQASSLFAKTKTEFARTKQKAMVKMGKADETVDIGFANEKQRFLDNYKAIKKLNKDTQKFLDVMKDLSQIQATLAEDFYEIYENEAPLYNATIKFQEAAKSFDQARQAMEDQIKADLISPTSQYIGQYKEIKGRLKEEDTRKVDMDRYSRDARTATEKAKSQGQLTHKEQKYETARMNYENLHNELLRDLPILHRDRIPFFDPALSTFLIAMSAFYFNASKIVQEPVPLIQHVNRSVIHDHPRVTTVPAESHAGHKSTAAPPDVQSPPRGSPSAVPPYAPQGSAVPPYAPTNNSAPPSGFGGPGSIASTTGYVPVNPSAPMATGAPMGGTGTGAMGTARPTPVPPTRARAPSLPGQIRATALYDFVPQESNELGFKVGDVIVITKQNGEWWEGEIGGRRGLLPSNYVKLM